MTDTVLLSASVSTLVSVAVFWSSALWLEPLLDWWERRHPIGADPKDDA